MFSADTLQQAFIQDYGRLCALAEIGRAHV